MKFISPVLLYLAVWMNSFHLLGKLQNNDTITIAWQAAPRHYDPRYAVDANSQYLENLLHCSLIDFDKNGTIVKYLSDRWTWVTPKTLQVEIKKNATFGDGTPVTAQDVQATYLFFLDKKVHPPSPRSFPFSDLQEIKVINRYTIQFLLKEPNATFINNLIIGILPKAVAQSPMIKSHNKIKGCGPYLHKESTLTSIHLEKNPLFSLGEKAKSHVVIKVVKDATTRFAKLQAGEVDLVQNGITLEKVKNINSYKNLTVAHQAALKTTYLGFNFRDPILSNRKVREAISLAIDRNSIIKYIFHNYAIPSFSMLPPSSAFFHKEIKEIRLNHKKANQLLDEAGYKRVKAGSHRMTLSYKTTNDKTRLAIAKVIASDLKKIGIQLKVQNLEWGRFKSDIERGNVQLWSLSWIGFKDPDIYNYAFSSQSFPPIGANRGRYSNPELDKLLKLGKETLDQEKRKQIYFKVQEILSRDLPYIYLFHESNLAVMTNKLKNFEVYADGRYSSLKRAYLVR